MTKKIVFISDFFADEIRGGAELCNDALIKLLRQKYTVETIKSVNVTESLLENNRDGFFIIANFFMLAEAFKLAFADMTYAILEHDHKYVASNNPSLYKDFLAPEKQLINKDFYTNAAAVMCQSKKHASVIQKNLLLNNIVSLSGNIWTEEQLEVLEKNIGTEKTIEYALLDSQNKNKGMPAAIGYCAHHGLQYELLRQQPFESFVANLAKVKHLVFFPQWLETYNRLSIEAKILGCKIITNNLIGAASEDYFKLNGKEMLDFIRQNNTTLLNKWFDLIEGNEVDYFNKVELPKVTVFCPLYAGERYIENFLKSIKNQTIFDQCELIIIDANSPENEEKHIREFMKTNKNVIYKKLDYRATVMKTENMALKMATGEFFAQACVDDRHSPRYLEILAKHLYYSTGIDLVYADCYQTTVPNETFENNTAQDNLYEHSKNKFSRENMIKCLPGPMPMWKKSIHEKAGYFNDELAHAGDWEMFLRMVKTGSKFKKVNIPLGLYYYNSEGLSTSPEHAPRRFQEESEVFFKYKEIFGQRNYERYKGYFQQFMRD